jgi:disulfide bond formation protein DsbB
MEFPPCALCWYQRIFMFPLVLILVAGLFPFDKNILKYAVPLAILGWCFAFYHTLVYSGIIPESLQPCGQGVSCSETYIDLFGFLTIPMLSLISFSTIIALLFILKRRLSK